MGSETKKRPILFSGEMVRAILDGRKTQTRRITDARGADRVLFVENAQLVPSRKGDNGYTGWVAEVDKLGGRTGLHLPLICPYGVAGDRLWVKETFRLSEVSRPFSTRYCVVHWASRITLEITKVRVERLQDISEADAEAEGVNGCDWGHGNDHGGKPCFKKPYAALWDSINGEGAWDKNPWVWVIEFQG